MSWRRSALLLGAVALSACGQQAEPPPAPAAEKAGPPLPPVATLVRLEPGPGERRQLSAAEVHVYPFAMREGWLLHLSLEQLGVDLAARVLAPDGSELFQVDSPTGTEGTEDVWLVADPAGEYRIEVKGGRGPYVARVEPLRPATKEDRRHAAAERTYYRARGLEKEPDVSRARLEGMYLDAARAWESLGSPKRAADAWDRLGRLRVRFGDGPGALQALGQSRGQYRSAGDRRGEAMVLHRIAEVHEALGSLDEAVGAWQESIPIWHDLGEVSNQASAVQNICQAAQLSLHVGETLDCYDRVFERLGALGMRRSQGVVQLDLGALYVSLGDLDRAFAAFRKALPLLQGDPNSRAALLRQLGNAYLRAGASLRAHAQFLETLKLARDPRQQATALNGIGLALRQARRYADASPPFRRALAIFEQLQDRRGQATVWNNVGWLHLDQRQPLPALAALQKGLELAAATGDRDVQVEALSGMARAELLKGNPIAARDRIERALAVAESVREGTGERDFSLDLLKATYLASRQDDYAFLIDLLRESGEDAGALQVSERARARSLSDALAVDDIPAALSPREIRESVLDDDTVLLEYSLGDDKSHLWWVDRDGLRGFELPGREVLEAAARSLHRLMATSHRRESRIAARRQAERLSTLLLGPVVDRLARKRLLIVAPDALQIVPFGALPLPGRRDSGGDWPVSLNDRHVVVRAPSASVLARLRAQRAGRRRPSLLLKLWGDPVTSALDDRLPSGTVDPRPEHGLPRLPHADDEVEAVLREARAAGDGEVSVAAGFDAVPEAVTGAGPIRASILHFVAHGLLDEASPENSAILLSRFDRSGRPREGRLRAGDIRGLDLEADLVVLSACQTGLGREVRGEGLVGLTHGFLAAGASAVVVSLWKVDDRATAELMERFYREMLDHGRPPDEALRAAQLSLRRETHWKAPYYWGGFVLQGDWLNNPPSGVSP